MIACWKFTKKQDNDSQPEGKKNKQKNNRKYDYIK